MTYDLHALIKENKVNDIKKAMANGADINVQDQDGRTPLLMALQDVSVEDEIIDLLFQYKPTVTVKDNRGNTALHSAVPRNNHEWVRLLLAQGADINARGENGMTPLLSALSFLHVAKATIDVLFRYKPDVKIADNRGNTALHIALQALTRDNHKWIRFREKTGKLLTRLLKYGADINAQDQHGRTPLLLVLYNAKVKEPVIRFLLRYQPNVTIADNEGNTAIKLMNKRSDLSDHVKGHISLFSIPYLYDLKYDSSFILSFLTRTGLPRELYETIISQVAAQSLMQIQPEISVEEREYWLKHMKPIEPKQPKTSEKILAYERCNRP